MYKLKTMSSIAYISIISSRISSSSRIICMQLNNEE